jgi:hypothetical protein
MNVKRWIGLLILIVGIVLIIFASYEKKRVAEAKGTMSTGKSFLPKNPMSDAFGNVMESKVTQYDAPLMWCTIGGIVLIIIGGGLLIFGRKK